MPLPRTIRVMVLLLLALLASGITTTPAHGTLVRGPNEHVHATGTVDFSDQLILTGAYASALPRGLGLSTDGNVIGFTGHVFDAETGLLLARLRVHDAVVLGRWLSRDPAGFVDGMNLYVYVRGNPLVWWDPLGMWTFDSIVRGLAAALSRPDQIAMSVRIGSSVARAQLASTTGQLMGAIPTESGKVQVGLMSGAVDQVLGSYEKGATAYERSRALGGDVAESLYVGASSTLSRQVGFSDVVEGLEGTDLQTGDRLDCGDRVVRTALGGVQMAAWIFPAARGTAALGRMSRVPARQAGEMIGGARQGINLVHMSTKADEVIASGQLGLPSNNYAGPASNATRTGWSLTWRTGLSPTGSHGAVPIPKAGEAAFSRVVPVGPITTWQRLTGQRYTARGVMDLGTGAFSRRGVNWNQAGIYASDIGISGGAIGGVAYLLRENRK